MGIRIGDMTPLTQLSPTDVFVVVKTSSNQTFKIESQYINLGVLQLGDPSSGSYDSGYVSELTSSMSASNAIQLLNIAINSVTESAHDQNTDVGTTNEYFKLHISGSSSVILKEESGSLLVRNNTDTAFAEITASNGKFDNVYASGMGMFDIIHANTMHVSSSILYASGSNKFGDSFDDIHEFTGSVQITGSAYIDDTLHVKNIISSSILDVNIVSSSLYKTDIIPQNVVYINNNNELTGSNDVTFNGTVFQINGGLEASYKSFKITHPSKPGMMLIHGSIEGPEYGVYYRGIIHNGNVIELPEYWNKLVDLNTITVYLTPIGKYDKLYVSHIDGLNVFIKNKSIFKFNKKVNCYYMVCAERKDINKINIESEI